MKRDDWLFVLCFLLVAVAFMIAFNGCLPKQDPLMTGPDIQWEIPQPVVQVIIALDSLGNADTLIDGNQ